MVLAWLTTTNWASGSNTRSNSNRCGRFSSLAQKVSGPQALQAS